MSKTKIFLAAALVGGLVFLPGCGKKEAPPVAKDGSAFAAGHPAGSGAGETGAGEYGAGESGSGGGDDLYEGAAVQGDVVEFSQDGCTITPLKSYEAAEGGMIAEGAAPGMEDPEENIFIHYQEGCMFQIVDIDVASGTKVFSDADLSDVRKQTSLIIHGEWVDAHNVNAVKVYLDRYE